MKMGMTMGVEDGGMTMGVEDGGMMMGVEDGLRGTGGADCDGIEWTARTMDVQNVVSKLVGLGGDEDG
jgi:hypothetical protein